MWTNRSGVSWWYLLTLKDDYCGYRQIYFLKNKSEVPEKMENFICMAENQTGSRVKIIRIDGIYEQ